MGVEKLWKELSPVCEKSVPISQLSGKTVAIDLSDWICELRSLSFVKVTHPNLYIKNLFHRISALLECGIKLIVVADGVAPEAKREAMYCRKKAADGRTDQSVDLARPKFNVTVKKCTDLLRLFGIPCLTAGGEAEAYCAGLNMENLVDGVITSDSDAFLYGARVVYQNLKKDGNWCVDVYRMEKIESTLHLDRDSLIAMALLVGCDYTKKRGVEGVGPKNALKLFEELRDRNGHDTPLKRMMEWRDNTELDKLTVQKLSPKDDPHCTNCRHSGRKMAHTKRGCSDCRTPTSCKSDNKIPCSCGSITHEQDRHKTEISIREKALKDESFPNKDVIDEFHQGSVITDKPVLHQGPVDVQGLLSFFHDNYTWKGMYGHVAQMIVKLQMLEMHDTVIKPIRVVKYCKRNAISCVEVTWKKIDKDDTTDIDFYTIIVQKDRFQKHYPQMLQEYEEEANAKRAQSKQSKPKGKKRGAEDSEQNTMKDYFKVVKK